MWEQESTFVALSPRDAGLFSYAAHLAYPDQNLPILYFWSISFALCFLYFNVSLLCFSLLNTIDLWYTLGNIHLFALQTFIGCQAAGLY